jgi:hypothetical protein
MTIDERFGDLIQADIDGEISAADKSDLEAFLASNEEGRAFYDELRAVSSSLDAMEQVEPPAYLRHVILGAVPSRTTADSKPRFLGRLFSVPVLGYAASFAAGLALAYTVIDSDRVSNRAFDDVTGLVGTVADLERAGPAHVVAAVDKYAVAGTVTLRSTGPLLILDFDLSAPEAVEIIARYSDQTIWFNGFAQLESSGTTVAAESGMVRLAMSGKRRYAVFLNNPGNRPAVIEMQFLAQGEVIHEASLEFDKRVGS